MCSVANFQSRQRGNHGTNPIQSTFQYLKTAAAVVLKALFTGTTRESINCHLPEAASALPQISSCSFADLLCALAHAKMCIANHTSSLLRMTLPCGWVHCCCAHAQPWVYFAFDQDNLQKEAEYHKRLSQVFGLM